MDAIRIDRELHREKQRFDLLKWLLLAVTVAFSVFMFLREFSFDSSDIYKHAVIASQFDFTDLHSITQRLAYPLWHLFVSALEKLGMPLSWSAALVSAACKALVFLLAHRWLTAVMHGKAPRWSVSVCTFLLMFVTGIRVPGVNDFVYKGVGSPTVWHNPTQQAVMVTALMIVPYLLHCWYEFARVLPEQGDKAMIPWRKVIVLAALLMVNLASKPTFAQALIPAAALFFLIEWIRHPKNSRYFLQIIAAFLPAVAYFLLQYLYYTGVVVPYTSGVAFGATAESVWLSVRNMALMAGFPLFAVLCCCRKGFFEDKTVVLGLLMVGVSMVEVMLFRETGVREDHGNFNWACMSSAFLLWVIMLPRFAGSLRAFRDERAQALKSGDRAAKLAVRTRSAAYFVGFVLLVWHAYSSFYYLYHLFVSGNTF